jgi:hypothetical protein
MKKKCPFICFLFLASLFSSAQSQPIHQLSLSAGWAGVSNDFYTVNTIGDVRFDGVTGLRFDAQYGYRVHKRVQLVAGLGVARHKQAIRIHRHHSEPLIPPTAENFVNEISRRTYLSFTTGANILLSESLAGEKLSVSLPIGFQNLLGAYRTIATDGNNPEFIGFQSWFWGLYTGIALDYQIKEGVALRLSPQFTQFFTQYPHYIGSQYSFDVSVGFVVAF